MARHSKTKSSKRAAIQNQPPTVKVNATEVRRLVSNVPAGTLLRFTYKRQYPQVAGYLGGMIDKGVISVDSPMVKVLIHAITVSGSWDSDRNRTFEVRTTDKFDVDWFVDRVGSDVESFEVLS